MDARKTVAIAEKSPQRPVPAAFAPATYPEPSPGGQVEPYMTHEKDQGARFTMRERLNRYEIAQETIGFMMATRSAAIHEAETAAVPDVQRIATLERELRDLGWEQDDLRLDDDAAIQRVIDVYGPIVKANFERLRALNERPA